MKNEAEPATPMSAARLLSGSLLRGLSLAFCIGCVAVPSLCETNPGIQSSLGSVVAPGDPVVFSASAGSDESGPFWYRFRVRRGDGPFSVVRDFGPKSELVWATVDGEGDYEIEVTVQNRTSGETGRAVMPFTVRPLSFDGVPVIAPTLNKLVYTYGMGPCPGGAKARVRFAAEGATTSTLEKTCDGVSGMSFYLAGLKPQTAYKVWHEVVRGEEIAKGPEQDLTTGEVALDLRPVTVSGAAVSSEGVLLQSSLMQKSAAHDTKGNLIWYYAGDSNFITRPLSGGRFLAIVENDFKPFEHQVMRLFDLAGITIKETNAARVSEQLAARGMRPITSFHHEAVELPDGKLLILAASERLLTNVQGSGEVNVIGDTIVVLDQELNLTWAWDSFDWLDASKPALLGEVCTVGGGGCPPFYLTQKANDWTHANSLQLAPDGNIIMSIRHLDQVIKIDYQNGVATGEVLWKLGRDGSFHVPAESGEMWPLFSHQHDAAILPDGTLLVYDNGNVRYESDSTAKSRGQVWVLDETTMTARLKRNIDLGVYALAVGSAQALANGGYHFNSGMILLGGGVIEARSVETDTEGKVVWTFSTKSPQYRTFRMKDIYRPN